MAGAQLWASWYNGPADSEDHANSIAVSPEGATVYVTGDSPGPSTSFDYATIAYDASTGAALWTSRYNGAANNWDVPTSIQVSPDGTRVFVSGYSRQSTSYFDYVTIAYDASSGATIWTRRRTANNGFQLPASLSVSADGSTLFMTGSATATTPYDVYWVTTAYDASNGMTLWTKRYNGPANTAPGRGDDVPFAIAASPSGDSVFVTGYTDRSASYHDYLTIAYDASNGATRWTRRMNGPGNNSDLATALAVSPDGTLVVVTGDSYGSSTFDDYLTIAYDASTGVRVWARRYNGPANGQDDAHALQVSPDGSGVFVTGQSQAASGADDYATIAYDASDGVTRWKIQYNGPGNADDRANALGVSPDGTQVYVTGQSDGGATFIDYATIAYDASTGTPLWTERFNASFNEYATALGVSPDGTRVFVTGYGAISHPYDFVTLAYAAT